jgi:hypothetical protein
LLVEQPVVGGDQVAVALRLEEFFPGQAQELFEGADVHCQTGAQRLAFARIYDWLEETFRD